MEGGDACRITAPRASNGSYSKPSMPPMPPPPAPLLLVPGVLGTMMGVRPAGQEGDGERCWVNARSADASFKQLWGRYSKGSGRVELLASGLEACVPRGPDDSGLYPISVLDPDVGGLVPPLKYFEPLIAYLQTRGYTPGLNLFGCGYDFRQSCRASAAAHLLPRLQQVSRRCGGARVDVVTHSMGGLVVRSLLADHPPEFEQLIGRWVAVGCPFGGAPGYTVDALLTGVQFGGSLGSEFFVKRETFRQSAVQSPSLYELLPSLDFPYAMPPPKLVLWLREELPDQPDTGCTALRAEPGQPAVQGGQAGGLEVSAGVVVGAATAGRGTTCALCPRCHGFLQLPSNAQAMAIPAGGSCGSYGSNAQRGACSAGREVAAPSSSSSSGSSSDGGSFLPTQYTFSHAHLPGVLTTLLKDNSVEVAGARVELPFEPEVWAVGHATHAAWAAAQLPPSCQLYNVYGNGVSTPWDCVYGSWWFPLQNLAALPDAHAAFTYVVGDGTVPAESARAHGLKATATVEVPGVSHRDLVGAQAVWDQLLSWLALPQAAAPATAVAVAGAALVGMAQHVGAVVGAPVGAQSVCVMQSGSSCDSRAAEDGAGGYWHDMVHREQQRQTGATHGEEECFWNPLVWQALLR